MGSSVLELDVWLDDDGLNRCVDLGELGLRLLRSPRVEEEELDWLEEFWPMRSVGESEWVCITIRFGTWNTE